MSSGNGNLFKYEILKSGSKYTLAGVIHLETTYDCHVQEYMIENHRFTLPMTQETNLVTENLIRYYMMIQSFIAGSVYFKYQIDQATTSSLLGII